MITSTVITNTDLIAEDLQIGDKLYDRLLSGTHGQRVEVEWIGKHKLRGRIYVAGVEEQSRHPVQLAYDNGSKVKVWRDG